MKRRRVLVSSYLVPQGDRDSGARRLSHLVEFLREAGWAVTFWASNGGGGSRYAVELQQAGITVYDGTKSKLEQLVSDVEFDLALIAFWPIAELYIPVLRRCSPRTRIIVDSVDLHFLRDARRIFRSSPDHPANALLEEDYASELIGELNSYVAADAVMTVSRKEADILGDFASGHSLATAVCDCEDMQLSSVPLPDRRGILSVASYKHPPNVEALQYLCREILPRVDSALLARHPLSIVGNGLDDKTRRMAEGLPHVRIVGWVPSVEPYFAQTRISVIPLLYGAGTKRKMIQSLMTGTPTVTTSVGAEGLDLEHGEHALIADDPTLFAGEIARLLEDDELWTRLSERGYQHICRRHGRESVKQQFFDVIEAVFERKPKPPMLVECSPKKHRDRINYQYYQKVAPAILEAVDAVVPPDAIVAIASEGSRLLLRLGARDVRHFPQNKDGSWRPEDFADAAALCAHLEEMWWNGAQYFVLPANVFGHYKRAYGGIRLELDSRFELISEQSDIGLIYSLAPSGARSDARENFSSDHANSGDLDFVGSALRTENIGTETTVRGADPTRIAEGHFSVSDNSSQTPHLLPAKLIAFYLPQFHPIAENDQWWGEGFTEWRNVAKSKPLFHSHDQPQLPADLGFYDLRLAETREAQADLARQYGIHGFCYYHYWFHGKRLLGRPLDDILELGKPDFPFCLCWANEPWSRRWDGSENNVLQAQSYSAADDIAHFRWLLKSLRDPRAITIDGKPVFIVYQARDLPDPSRTTDTWRREAELAGLNGLYLMTVETARDEGWDATKVGFDAKIGFQPQFSLLNTTPRLDVGPKSLRVFDYRKAWPVLAEPKPVVYPRYETVFPSWDNTPRKGADGWVVHNSTPQAYGQWLKLAIDRAMTREPQERIVFINAWNEWAEGCHLEPDQRHGLAYLEATRRAIMAGSQAPVAHNGHPVLAASKRTEISSLHGLQI